MKRERVAFIQKVLDNQLTEKEVEILTTDFSKLNTDERHRCLDLRMDLMAEDLQDETEFLTLFEQCDSMERYSDILRQIIAYPRLVSEYYASTKKKYNFATKWDWDLSKLEFLTPRDWMYDLICTAHDRRTHKKLVKVLRIKIMKKYNINIVKEYDDLNKFLDDRFTEVAPKEQMTSDGQ